MGLLDIARGALADVVQFRRGAQHLLALLDDLLTRGFASSPRSSDSLVRRDASPAAASALLPCIGVSHLISINQ